MEGDHHPHPDNQKTTRFVTTNVDRLNVSLVQLLCHELLCHELLCLCAVRVPNPHKTISFRAHSNFRSRIGTSYFRLFVHNFYAVLQCPLKLLNFSEKIQVLKNKVLIFPLENKYCQPCLNFLHEQNSIHFIIYSYDYFDAGQQGKFKFSSCIVLLTVKYYKANPLISTSCMIHLH